MYRGFQYRITRCAGTEETRYNGDLKINGEWVPVSPEALDYETIFREFDERIDQISKTE